MTRNNAKAIFPPLRNKNGEQGGGLHTALTVSAIFATTMMTARRLRQKAATVSLLSTSLSLAWALRTPMSKSLERTWPSMRARNGSWAGRRERRWARERREPHSLLYLLKAWLEMG